MEDRTTMLTGGLASIRIERQFLAGLEEIAAKDRVSPQVLVAGQVSRNDDVCSALGVNVRQHVRSKAAVVVDSTGNGEACFLHAGTNRESNSQNMSSPVLRRAIAPNGHKTSVSVEDEFWAGLKEIAAEKMQPCLSWASQIESDRTNGNVSSAIRLYILDYYVKRVAVNPVEGIAEPTSL